jgi:hypothetical protein
MNTVASEVSWRQAAEADLPMIDAIGNGIHLSLLERPEVFAEKIRLFPAGCHVLIHSGEIAGYGISHPWQLYSIPPLDTFLEALPLKPDCIFIRLHGRARCCPARPRAVGDHHLACAVMGTERRHFRRDLQRPIHRHHS